MQASSEPDISTEIETPLRLGIVGCSLARLRYGAAFALLPGVQITALADPDARLMRAWSRTLGSDAAQFDSISALLSSDDLPDALVLETPLAERGAALLAAIPSFKAILCAPPFAPTLEETDRILHAAAAHETRLMPAFPLRFDPVVRQATELANTGEAGLVQQVRCDWSFPLTRAFGAEIGADPDAGTWTPLLQYVACHAADLCRWCLGDVLTVSADVDSESATIPDGSRKDFVPLLANLVLGQENGPATCHFARARSVNASQRCTFTGSLGHLELVIASSTKSADDFPALMLHRTGLKPQAVPPPEFDACRLSAPHYRMRAMLLRFAQHVRRRDETDGSGDSARAALEVVHAAYLSAHDRRKITLPLRRSPVLPS
jgi:predicted dehydrogenase